MVLCINTLLVLLLSILPSCLPHDNRKTTGEKPKCALPSMHQSEGPPSTRTSLLISNGIIKVHPPTSTRLGYLWPLLSSGRRLCNYKVTPGINTAAASEKSALLLILKGNWRLTLRHKGAKTAL